MAVAAIPAAIAAVGAIVGGVAQAGAANRQAAAADANAEEAKQQGEAQAGLIRERARRVKGANIANAGASGVDISGSFADVLDDNDIAAELDAQTAIRNAKVQANNFKAESRNASAGRQAALVGAAFGAGTQALNSWGNWKLLQAQGGSDGGGGTSSWNWTAPASGHGGAR